MFFNFVKFKFIFKFGNFLLFQKKNKIIDSIVLNMIIFIELIELISDKNSMFKIINAKNAINMMSSLPNIEAIIYDEKKFSKTPKKNIF